MAILRPDPNANPDTSSVNTEKGIDKWVETRDIPQSEIAPEPAKKEEVKCLVKLSKEQHKAMKVLCAAKETTIQDFIVAAKEAAIEKEKASS